jgi:putative SOS response-associated peptidase YedK
MCGRYRLTKRRLLEIENYYGVDDVNDLDIWERQFNIPPTEMAPIVFNREGRRNLTAGFWSLLPPRAESLKDAYKFSTFNAKAETLSQRPSFKDAFLKQRCIVPAEAFYEWIGPKGKRQPLHITRRDGNFLSMAGLVSFWKPAASEGRPIPTFTIITTEPSAWMSRIHNRMPAILQDQQIEGWLDSATEMRKLSEMLKRPPEEFLNFYPVDAKLVNSSKIDAPECVERINIDVEPFLETDSSSEDTQQLLF